MILQGQICPHLVRGPGGGGDTVCTTVLQFLIKELGGSGVQGAFVFVPGGPSPHGAVG
jgi:hypothetical protein